MLLCAGLLSEALAYVDLLVLTRTRQFTGLADSSFSWLVRVSLLLSYVFSKTEKRFNR